MSSPPPHDTSLSSSLASLTLTPTHKHPPFPPSPPSPPSPNASHRASPACTPTIFPTHARRHIPRTSPPSTHLHRLLDDFSTATHGVSHGLSAPCADARAGARTFFEALSHDGYACIILEGGRTMPLTFGDMPQGGYVVMLTALEQDDIRLVGGSVFSVYERVSEPGTVGRDVDLERSGCEQIAAGYVIYAAGTRLYYSIGAGVFGFVLHPMAMQYFQTGGQGVFAKGWDVYGDVRKVAGLGGFVRGKGGRVYETGCVVADFDAAVRNGGLFVAHVHVLCMGFALAYVAEQLEGMAVDMKGRRLLDRCVERGHVHGRVVMLAGCEQVVNSFLQFMKA